MVPKPVDWPSFIDVVGYLFLEEAALSSFQPPADLTAFLEAGPPPVYVGFGSLVIRDPARLTACVGAAAAAADVRLIVHKASEGIRGTF